LFRDEAGKKSLAAYFVRYGSGPFRFIVPAGSYQLFAFEDANGNMGYDDGEMSYYVGDRQPALRVTGAATHDAGTIRMAVQRIEVAELRAAAKRDLTTEIGLTSVHRGTVISLDDPRFTVESGKDGMWTPLQSVLENGAGIFFIEPYDPSRIPVVFVHGVSGTAGDFRALVDALDKRRFQAWFFQYPSGARLENAARFLQTLLAEMQARHRFERYIVVAHSAGGLVARSALTKIQKEGGALPCAFVTISTPWLGIESAETGTRLSPVVLPAWIDLAPGSPFVRTMFDTPLRPAVSWYLLFGYAGGDGTDGAVSLKSMLRPVAQAQANDVLAFAESHRSILRSPESIRAVNERLHCMSGLRSTR
jgi:pimeloyl-ACP methyl ester carboxylesterase